MPYTLQNRQFLHSDFFLKLFGQDDIQLVPISNLHCALHKGLTSVICCENENKILLTRIFSTRVKGVSKARTKMVAALREMRRPPMKYITTLNMVIWAVDVHWRIKFMLILHRVGRTRRRVRTCWWSPCGWGNSSRWVGREGQRRARLESHWQVLHNPRDATRGCQGYCCWGFGDTFVQAKMTQERAKLQASLCNNRKRVKEKF